MSTKTAGILGVLLLISTWAWPEPMPSLRVTSLDGQSLALPDPAADATVLVVGFSRKAGDEVKPWADRFERDFGARPRFACYSVVVLAGVPPLLRSLVLGFIKNGTDSKDRSRLFTTFQDEEAWKAVVGFGRPDEPYVVVVDREGRIGTSLRGAFDASLYEATANHVRALLADSSKPSN